MVLFLPCAIRICKISHEVIYMCVMCLAKAFASVCVLHMCVVFLFVYLLYLPIIYLIYLTIIYLIHLTILGTLFIFPATNKMSPHRQKSCTLGLSLEVIFFCSQWSY